MTTITICNTFTSFLKFKEHKFGHLSLIKIYSITEVRNSLKGEACQCVLLHDSSVDYLVAPNSFGSRRGVIWPHFNTCGRSRLNTMNVLAPQLDVAGTK